MKRIASILLVGWLLGRFAGCMLLIPGPWGPEVRGALPSGGHVAFRSRGVGRETDDQLIWVSTTGGRQEFWVNQTHAGPSYVSLKMRDDGAGVWVEANGKVLSSLDLATGEFRDEYSEKHPWAVYGNGAQLASGRTGGLLQLIWPL